MNQNRPGGRLCLTRQTDGLLTIAALLPVPPSCHFRVDLAFREPCCIRATEFRPARGDAPLAAGASWWERSHLERRKAPRGGDAPLETRDRSYGSSLSPLPGTFQIAIFLIASHRLAPVARRPPPLRGLSRGIPSLWPTDEQPDCPQAITRWISMLRPSAACRDTAWRCRKSAASTSLAPSRTISS
jgi:hypothetical protein